MVFFVGSKLTKATHIVFRIEFD